MCSGAVGGPASCPVNDEDNGLLFAGDVNLVGPTSSRVDGSLEVDAMWGKFYGPAGESGEYAGAAVGVRHGGVEG